jgi:hypothetical protein
MLTEQEAEGLVVERVPENLFDVNHGCISGNAEKTCPTCPVRKLASRAIIKQANRNTVYKSITAMFLHTSPWIERIDRSVICYNVAMWNNKVYDTLQKKLEAILE